MKIIKFTIGLFLAGMCLPAFAQSIPDDVRCMALSNAFAKGAPEGPQKQTAAKALLFYLGRLDARGNPQAVRSAMQSVKIDPKAAAAEMGACARRFANAAQTVQALGKAVPPKK